MVRYFWVMCFLVVTSSFVGAKPMSFDDAVDKNVSEFLKRTKKKGKYAVKIVSSKDFTPQESLSIQVETAVAASIQKLSNFESEIVPRASIGAIWNEKSLIDNKSDADFGDLISKVKADYLVLISIAPAEKNSFFSMQLYGLQGGSEGRLIFSSSLIETVVPGLTIQVKASEISQELKLITAQINSISKNGGIFDKPKNYSELYHNARLYSQRGEIDLAIQTYDELIKNRIQFADTIEDFVSLLKRLYGKAGAIAYIEKKVKDKAPRFTYLFAKQILDEKPIAEIWEDESSVSFPPLQMLFFMRCTNDMTDAANQNWESTKNCRYRLMLDPTSDDKIFRLGENAKNGDVLQFFVDPIRAESGLGVVVFQSENHFSTMHAYIKHGGMKRAIPPVAYCGSMAGTFCK
jgi:hypothetical protein